MPIVSIAQNNKYLIIFKDKNNTSFDPCNYFDTKTIERRIKFNIPLYDFTDFPVNQYYLQEVLNNADSFTVVTRWFNGVFIYTDNYRINKIELFPFVKDVEYIETNHFLQLCNIDSFFDYEDDIDEKKIELLQKQIDEFVPSSFFENKINGQGVRIAVFDGGFPKVNTHEAFEHIRKNNRIIKTYDFVKKKDFVYSYNSHGMMVLSCIAGICKGKQMGLATESEFLLARTEKESEPFAEEEYWLAAAEWADKNGADIINSSLGYTYHRYFYKDMDGKQTLVARAANMASSKGILVVNAAGNDGDNAWKYINTPGDADSVLTVGGIDPYKSNLKINFSSVGPTYDKRLKPNVCGSGMAVVATKKGYGINYGTSFASPLVAGFAACVKQLYEDSSNMSIFNLIQQSASLFPYYDYYHGYGIPNAHKLMHNEELEPTFEVKEDENTYKVIIKNNFKCSESEPLFYHILNSSGYLDKYYVVKVCQKIPLEISKKELDGARKFRIHYKGYTSKLY